MILGHKMRKILLIISIMIAAESNDCVLYLQSAYKIGYQNMGGAMNYQHAQNICMQSLSLAGLSNYSGAFEACMKGIDKNLMNKDMQPIYDKFCFNR